MAKPKLSTLKPVDLTPFEGRPVTAVALEVKNTGYGLEQSMTMEPVELHHGDEVNLLFRCTVEKIRYDGVKEEGSDDLVRVQILAASDAILVDEQVVADVIEAHRKKLSEAAGVPEFDFTKTVAEGGDSTSDEPWEQPDPLANGPRADDDAGADDEVSTKRKNRDAAARASGEGG